MEFIETIFGTLDGKDVKAYTLKSAGPKYRLDRD
jgi:hypothetical protein